VPGIQTPAIPAPVAFGDDLYLFVRRPVGTVAWSRFQPRLGWAEWQAIPGEARLAGAPFAVVHQGRLQLFCLGADGRLYQTRLAADGTWADWGAVPGAATVATGPRGALWQGDLLLFAQASTNQVLCQRLSGEWAGWRPLEGLGEVITSPHPIAWGGQLHLFLTGPDRVLRRASLPPGGPWSQPQRIPGAPPTSLPPWAVSHRAALVLGATALAGQVMLTRQQPLSGWQEWQRLPAEWPSDHGPALSSFSGRLYRFVTTNDGTVHWSCSP
jgi:hypothetical protein